MAFSRTFIASSILLSLILLHVVQAHQSMSTDGATSPSPLPKEIDCGVECSRRCELSSRLKLCKRACGSCCEVCHCVPPGTSGNEDTCPCYANLTTHHNAHKCP